LDNIHKHSVFCDFAKKMFDFCQYMCYNTHKQYAHGTNAHADA